jgi:hypothetical protein
LLLSRPSEGAVSAAGGGCSGLFSGSTEPE